MERFTQPVYTGETEVRAGKEYLLYNDKLIIANDGCIQVRYDLTKITNYSLTLHDDSIYLRLDYKKGIATFEILQNEVEGSLSMFQFKLAKIFDKHFK